MKFDDFCTALLSLLGKEPVSITETTNLKDEINVDSLEMVNLVVGLSEHFNVPFEHFIQNVDRLNTVGGLYDVVKEAL